MKNLINLLLLSIIALFFVNCGGSSATSQNQNVQTNLSENGDKPETAKKVKEFSGKTENVKINLSDFLDKNTTTFNEKVIGDFVSRETDDFSRKVIVLVSVWYNNDTYERMDIPFSEEFSLKLPNAQNVDFYISLRDVNDRELFFGQTFYSGNPEKLSVELVYNSLRKSQVYVSTIDKLPELPFDISDLDEPNAVIYFADGGKSDAIALEGEGDKAGFKLSQVWLNKNGSLEIDNHWSLRDLPVKVVLLESDIEIYLDFKLSQFAVEKETTVFEKNVETEVSLSDPRLKAFKEGVIYEGEQNNISFQTDKVYYLICTPSEEDFMQDPILTVNGQEYDDYDTLYPEPVLLEVGFQSIQVRNLSNAGSGFELQIIPEDEYIGDLLGDLDK